MFSLPEEVTGMSKFAGKKMAKRHTTAIPAADPIITAALRMPEVKKIVLGRIVTGCTGLAPGLDIEDIDNGLKCTVRGNTSKQEIFVCTTDRHATASALNAVAPNGRGKQRKKQHEGNAPLPPDTGYLRNGADNGWPF